MMDCIHARLLIVLQGRAPHELDADARAALETHLEHCADCLAWSSQEGRVDEAMRQAIVKVPVPAALPSKILHTLEGQRRPRRAPWLSAAAAVLLLGLATGGYFWFTVKPVLTWEYIHEYVVRSEQDGWVGVVDRFAELDLTVEIPQGFSFDHYNGSSVAMWRGQKIPRLEFVNRGDGDTRAAAVYILAKDRFNVDEIVNAVDQPAANTSSHHIEVKDFRIAGFLYVIVYAGPVQPFFVRNDVQRGTEL